MTDDREEFVHQDQFNEDLIKIDTRDFHGHPDYLDLTIDELELHSAKNKDYTKGGDPLGNFKRVANILSNYPGLDLSDPSVVAIVFSMKQMDRALWQMSQGYEGDLESVDGSMTDTHIYWKIARILHKEEQAHDAVQGQS